MVVDAEKAKPLGAEFALYFIETSSRKLMVNIRRHRETALRHLASKSEVAMVLCLGNEVIAKQGPEDELEKLEKAVSERLKK